MRIFVCSYVDGFPVYEIAYTFTDVENSQVWKNTTKTNNNLDV